jgi:hypothetical protein
MSLSRQLVCTLGKFSFPVFFATNWKKKMRTTILKYVKQKNKSITFVVKVNLIYDMNNNI